MSNTIEIEVCCDCGEELEDTAIQHHTKGLVKIYTKLCKKCAQKAKDEGYDMGFVDGKTNE